MLRSADLTLWLLTTLVEAFVVYLFLIQRVFRKFLFLYFYLLLSAMAGMSEYALLCHFGLDSSEYFYFYYFTDVPLTICLFVGICELSVHLVGTKIPRRKVVSWSAGALLATAWFSFSVAWSSGPRLIMHFIVELSQNIYIACCLTIVLLWAWQLRNDPEDRMAARFVSVLSVYFSLFILNYGANQIAPPELGLTNSLPPMMAAWLPLGCGFALVSHEEPRRTKH